MTALQRKVFVINPYDPCVDNCDIAGIQMTVIWNVNYMKLSHSREEEVKKMIQWMQETFSGDGIGDLKITRGRYHQFLGMNFDFSKEGEVRITMRDFVKKIVEDFPDGGKKQETHQLWTFSSK